MLTKRQKQIFDFVTDFIKNKDYSPTYEEIRRHFRLKSVSTIHDHISILHAKGHLKKEAHQPRGFEPYSSKGKTTEIPLMGLIAAGKPIEAIENPEPITISKSKLDKSGRHYALKVKGDSMIDEGIFDGDTVVIRQQKIANNGEVVVALINGNEATLKKIYKEKNGFRLQPANSSMPPIFTKELVIQGKVVSVIRDFKELKKLATSKKKKVKKKKFKLDRIITDDVLETMGNIPGNSVHLAITSPPYNVGKDYDNHFDKLEYQKYLDWLEKVWAETKRVLVPGGRFALNIAPTGIKNFKPLHSDFTYQLRSLGMIFRTEIIWYKQTMLKRTAWGSFKSPANPHIVPSWEYVLIFSKGQPRLDGDPKKADISKKEFMDFSDGVWNIPPEENGETFWPISPETQRRGHPAPFPEELIYRLIKFYSYKGNTVLDMFGGTGTVAAVAHKIKRHFVHIDISEEYNNIANKRLEKV